MQEFAVEASNVARQYGERRALDGFSVAVPPGGVFGLLGPNGSGKSTFIAMLAAMEQPSSGTLEVLGEAPSRQLLRRIGTVFQENTADPLMQAQEYLEFAGALFGLGRNDAKIRARDLLERFGLGPRANDRISSLSGGMRRRLEVARALVHRPDLLVLDEPTTGVDADERSNLWQALIDGNDGMTILLATNDLHEADQVCAQVAFVRAGKAVAAGTPKALKAGLRAETVRVTVADPSAELAARIANLPGVGEVTSADGVLAVATDDASALAPRLFELAAGRIRSVAISEASLEDAYFFHVGRREGRPE